MALKRNLRTKRWRDHWKHIEKLAAKAPKGLRYSKEHGFIFVKGKTDG